MGSYFKVRKNPYIMPPLQHLFCQTIEELGVDYGLSLLGPNPHKFPSIISEEKWLTIFTCPFPKTRQHIKEMTVRAEFHQKFFFLHYKVYKRHL